MHVRPHLVLAISLVAVSACASACTEHRTLDPRPEAANGIPEAAPHARGYEVPIDVRRTSEATPKKLEPRDVLMPDDPFGLPPSPASASPSAVPLRENMAAPKGKSL